VIWVVIAILCAAAAAALVWPILRNRTTASTARRDYDLAVYRDQLAELDRDLARGLLSGEEHRAAQLEVQRRMLAADRPETSPHVASHRVVPLALAIGTPIAAIFIYLAVGAPWMSVPSPAAEEARVQRAEIARFVDRLAERLNEAPDDARGWSMLGRSYALLERYPDAIAAYERAEKLAPHDADLVARHAEALIMAERGTIGEASRALIAHALAIDPAEPRARFYLGLAEAQAGRGREALTLWVALERDSPPDSPARRAVSSRIDRLARDLGLDPTRLPGREAPSAEPQPAPTDMSAEDRAKMIRGMVDSLAARLEREPNDAEGWARLGRSYGVLGEREKSRDAWRHAVELRPDDAEVLAEYASAILTLSGDAQPPAEFVAVAAALIKIAPDSPDALWFAGVAARARGDAASAIIYWRKLLERLPAESQARETVARAIAELSGR
jgi:cytochrome c-type biogenesis protein CcmH